MPNFIITWGALETTVNRGNSRAAIIAAFNAFDVDFAQGTHVLIENEQGEAAEVVVARGHQGDPWPEVPRVKTPRGPIVPVPDSAPLSVDTPEVESKQDPKPKKLKQ